MVQSNRCQECSAELPDGVADVLCPQCLLAMRLRETADPPGDPDALPPVSNQEAQPLIERDLGAVQLQSEIGRGSVGIVYRGHDTVLGRDVAVKFLSKAGGRDDPAVARFLDEARCAAAVRHPNLTQIYQAEIAADTPYLVMEFVNGPSLRRLLRDCGPMPLAPALLILGEIGPAVAELHARGIVHRDLKPSNVLLDSAGHVFVTDFGMALLRSSRAGASSAEPAGSPAYMAPEAFDGHVSPRSDMYALGVLAYELLTASIPFTGTIQDVIEQHRSAALPTEPLARAGVSPAVIEVIERATSKKPIFRYKSPQDFLRALRDAAPEGASVVRAKTELTGWMHRPRGSAPAGKASAAAGSSTSLAERLGEIVAWKRKLRSKIESGAPVCEVATPAAAWIAIDLPCIGCTYNLRTLSRDANCPECGVPVAPSLERERLVFADPSWVRKLRLGLLLIAASPIALIGFTVVTSLIYAFVLRDSWLDKHRVLGNVFMWAALISVATGFVLATWPRPGFTSGWDLRRICRWLLAVDVALIATLPTAAFQWVVGLLLFAPVSVLLIYLGRLTRTLPESNKCRRYRHFALRAMAITVGLSIVTAVLIYEWTRHPKSSALRQYMLHFQTAEGFAVLATVMVVALSLLSSRRELRGANLVAHESLFADSESVTSASG